MRLEYIDNDSPTAAALKLIDAAQKEAETVAGFDLLERIRTRMYETAPADLWRAIC